MEQIPAFPDAARLLGKLLLATRKGVIPWESAGNDNALKAKLPDYELRLLLVPDFDDGPEFEPDHILEVYLQGRLLFKMDRRNIDIEALSAELGEEVQYSFKVFAELWLHASFISSKVSQHLEALNTILDKEIAKS